MGTKKKLLLLLVAGRDRVERERVSSSIIGAAASLQEWPEKRAGIQLGQI